MASWRGEERGVYTSKLGNVSSVSLNRILKGEIWACGWKVIPNAMVIVTQSQPLIYLDTSLRLAGSLLWLVSVGPCEHMRLLSTFLKL